MKNKNIYFFSSVVYKSLFIITQQNNKHIYCIISDTVTQPLWCSQNNHVEHQELFLLRAISRAISLSSSGDGGFSASGGYSMYDLCNIIRYKGEVCWPGWGRKEHPNEIVGCEFSSLHVLSFLSTDHINNWYVFSLCTIHAIYFQNCRHHVSGIHITCLVKISPQMLNLINAEIFS